MYILTERMCPESEQQQQQKKHWCFEKKKESRIVINCLVDYYFLNGTISDEYSSELTHSENDIYHLTSVSKQRQIQ